MSGSSFITNVILAGGKAYVFTLAKAGQAAVAVVPVYKVKADVPDLAAALEKVFQAGNPRRAPSDEAGPSDDLRLKTTGFTDWTELACNGAYYLLSWDDAGIHLEMSQRYPLRRRGPIPTYLVADESKTKLLPPATPMAEVAGLILADAEVRPEVWQEQPPPPPPPSAQVRPMPNFAYRAMMAAMWVEDRVHSPRRLLAKAPLRPGQTVVDYACGPGRYTIPAAEIVGPAGRVYAVDSQPLAIATVKKKAAQAHLTNIQAVLVDSFDTGLPGGSADLVLLIDAITPIRNRTALLTEIHRLLKPAGQLFMDASHFSAEHARRIVAETKLFELVKEEGRVMLWRKAKEAV